MNFLFSLQLINVKMWVKISLVHDKSSVTINTSCCQEAHIKFSHYITV